MLVLLMHMTKAGDEDCHSDPRQQCQRKCHPVMRMELQFRQQVRRGDAEKRARAKRERCSHPSGMEMWQTTK